MFLTAQGTVLCGQLSHRAAASRITIRYEYIMIYNVLAAPVHCPNTSAEILRTLSLTVRDPSCRFLVTCDSSANPEAKSTGQTVPSGGSVPFAKNARI